MTTFAVRLIEWQGKHGRHGLPWQQSRDPYSVWLSEIMLQQTQVASVIPYYRRFLARFPDIANLAAAGEDEVLAHWSGLGYYSRARNLQRAARVMVERHGGSFPRDFARILELPGIGRSTAAAIAVFAFGERRAILDGNVKRVLARYFAVGGYPGATATEAILWQWAEHLLPDAGIEIYTQALMDLGATVCTRSAPRCGQCPVREDCLAHRQGRQMDLPHARPRKALPERSTVMLLLLRQGDIFLEKRPPTGIWAGMWSFPETDGVEDMQRHCRERFGFETELHEPLPALRHSFTHFHLAIRPQLVQVTGVRPGAREGGGLWLNIDDALGAAIPAPARRLLLDLASRCGEE